MSNIERFKEKLNALLVEEMAGIAIISGKLAYVFPEVTEYSTGKKIQEKSIHATQGIAVTYNIHLGLSMPEPIVWITENEPL